MRIMPAEMIFGIAAIILFSMLMAGSEMASICNAFSAEISAGTKTSMKTTMLNTFETRMVTGIPDFSASASIFVAESRFETRSRRIFATSQPTKPMTPAAKMFGSMARILSTISRTGDSNPSSWSAPRIAGRNKRMISQKSTLPILLPMEAMPASSPNASSNRVEARPLVVRVLTTVASTQATSAKTPPEIIFGRYSNTWEIKPFKGSDTIGMSSLLNTATRVINIMIQ